MEPRRRRITSLLLLVILVCACNMGPMTTRDSTLEAISSTIRLTATAQAAANSNPNASVETAQAASTAQGQLAAATQTAEASLSDEARSATANAAAPILAELPKFGVDPAVGRLAWTHPPVSLEVNGYMTYDYTNHFIATVARDFVVSADITWNTEYGTSGCGFVLRSDGNKDALNQYMAIITRGSSGHLLFAIVSDGDIVGGRDIYAYGKDSSFNISNGGTNRLTVVGRGNLFTIFTNGSKIGEIDPTKAPGPPSPPDPPANPALQGQYDDVVAQMQADYAARQRQAAHADKVFERGFIAMVVLSESGRSQCQFDNGWLWLIE